MNKYISIKDMEITHPNLQTIIDTAVAWQERRKSYPAASMVMLGSNGTGKTMLATAMLWTECLTLHGRPVAYIGKFYKANKLVVLLRENNIKNLIPTNAGIMVLDDVGDEGQQQYVNAKLQKATVHSAFSEITEYCLQHNISLVITGSNNVLTRKAFWEYIGGRAWERISLMAPVQDDISFVVSFKNIPNYREKLSGRNTE